MVAVNIVTIRIVLENIGGTFRITRMAILAWYTYAPNSLSAMGAPTWRSACHSLPWPPTQQGTSLANRSVPRSQTHMEHPPSNHIQPSVVEAIFDSIYSLLRMRRMPFNLFEFEFQHRLTRSVLSQQILTQE